MPQLNNTDLVLLIDNYDSFTFNLYDYIQQLGYECKVIRNDEYTLNELRDLEFDTIVISPGPGTPAESGITMAVIDYYFDKKPILGICLGHQAIGVHFGAKLIKAHLPMHGKTSIVEVDQKARCFKGFDKELEVMRYHSLILQELPSNFKATARTRTSEIMAIEHLHLPIAGLQFHPESILTEKGIDMLGNWFESLS